MHLPLAALVENLKMSSEKERKESGKQANFEEKELGISRKLEEIENSNLNSLKKKL